LGLCSAVSAAGIGARIKRKNISINRFVCILALFFRTKEKHIGIRSNEQKRYINPEFGKENHWGNPPSTKRNEGEKYETYCLINSRAI